LVETISEECKKLDLKCPSKREEYLTLIDRLLEVAFAKAMSFYTKNSERIAWMRAMTGLVKAGSIVLSDTDLEDIEVRLRALEEQFKRGEKL